MEKSKKFLKLNYFLFFFLFIHFFYRIWNSKEKYLVSFNPDYWQNRYFRSQWVVPDSQEKIGDDGLYAYAGWEYINGLNPTLINPEVPPLGKYLIGLTILVFKNQAVFAIFTGITSLVVLYFFSRLILNSEFWAWLVVFLFSLEPLFYNQLKAPFLDLLYLTFLLLFFTFLFKKKFFWTAMFLGLLTATKNTLTSFFLGNFLSLSYLFLKNKKFIKKYIIFLPFSLAVLLLTYGKYFLSGYSFKDFLGLQKYIYLTFYNHQIKINPLLFGEMILLGKWRTWWGTKERIEEWHPFWPILLGTAVVFLIREIVFKKTKTKFLLIFLWLIFYSCFLCFIPVWPRYFLLLLPFFYLSTAALFKEKIKF